MQDIQFPPAVHLSIVLDVPILVHDPVENLQRQGQVLVIGLGVFEGGAQHVGVDELRVIFVLELKEGLSLLVEIERPVLLEMRGVVLVSVVVEELPPPLPGGLRRGLPAPLAEQPALEAEHLQVLVEDRRAG